MPLEAVLFDLDGTLLDTALDFQTALNQLLEEEGRPPMEMVDFREHITNGSVGIIRSVFEIKPEDEGFKDLQTRLLSFYKACLTDRTKLFEGLESTLEFIRKQSLPWGVITNKPSEYAEPIIEKILPDCGVLVCPDHVKMPKPNPEGMFLACKKLGINATQCVYVGDHERDIEAGKAAYMPTIAVGWGYIERGDDHKLWGADIHIEQPSQLLTTLTELHN